jgi:RNA polymerase sigma factor (sigma-70 family)
MDILPLSKEWELTQEAFDGLLNHLSNDREQAAEVYEEILRKLTMYFEFRGCHSPGELADETINRVARRIQEGETILARDVASYFYGVARNVVREYWKAADRTTALLEMRPHTNPLFEAPDEVASREVEHLKQEQRFECLQTCLQSLPEDARRMILLYYRDEKGAQIKTRQALADQMNIPGYALRLRVSRVLAKLYACINRCLGEGY